MDATTHDASNATSNKRSRPCDTCRRRKRRCVIEADDTVCKLCRAADGQCTFDAPAVERPSVKRPFPGSSHHHNDVPDPSAVGDSSSFNTARGVIEDYDALPVPSLLKTNLGLQQHRYIRYVGPSDELETSLLALRPVDEKQETLFPNGMSCRRVSRDTHFALTPYSETHSRTQEIEDLDAIESIVRPHGRRLVNIYFQFVHPSFPILDKRTFMEKYTRTYREFSPPCLAGVYMLASRWWHYDRELSSKEQPDTEALEKVARTSLQNVIDRPKLSTVQGGLLLLQFRGSSNGAWALSSQLVAVAQELGLDATCADWAIPAWEKGLRTRLGWTIFMMDKWMALCQGRASHIVDENWTPDSPSEDYFWELQDDEEDDMIVEGSTDADAGRIAFESMISLTRIVSEILLKFYSRRAHSAVSSNIRSVLEHIKPVQMRLRSWHQDLPSSVHLDTPNARILSPNAALHLNYFAAEIALHKIISSALLRFSCDSQIIRICRRAARERVITAVDLVTKFESRHLQAFWYFSSGYCLITIGTFTALLFLTSRSTSEAEFYKKKLDDYRWFLRLSSNSSDYVRFAVQKLDLALSHIHELEAADIVSVEESEPEPLTQPEAAVPDDHLSAPRGARSSRTAQQSESVNSIEGPTTPPFYEDAVLHALSNGTLLTDEGGNPYTFPASLLPRSPGIDPMVTTPRTLDYDYQRFM